MKIKNILFVVLIILLIQPSLGEDTIYPTKDATVDKWFATTSYTTPIIAFAGSDGTDYKRGFIEFNITNYSDSSAVSSAKLYIYSNDENTPGNFYFQRLTQTWSEPITWNTQPTLYTSTNQVSETINSLTTWYELDVTDQFKDAIDAGNGYYGIRLISEEDNTFDAALFMSSEEANKPYINVSISVPTPTPTPTPTATPTAAIPIVSIPPVLPSLTPTETPPPDEEWEEKGIIEIIDEVIEETLELIYETIIEPTKVVIEEVVTHISSTFNWVLLGFVYLSTLAGRIVNKIEDAATLVIDTALYGTIALIVILLSSFIGLAFIFSNELIAVIVFVVVGFIFGILPEFIRKDEELPGN